MHLSRGPSKHFSWREVNPHGFSGLTIRLRYRSIRHANNLEKLRAKINQERVRHGYKETGMHILSWWRPEWYNRQIGGARYSRHIQADACDITREEVNRLCPWRNGHHDFDNMADYVFRDGGFGTYPGGNRHVDSRGYRARWSSF